MRRAVVTGIGVVSSLGSDLNRFWDRLKSGTSGIRRIQSFDPTNFVSQIAGEVVEFEIDKFIPPKEQRRTDPFCHYAVGAAKMSVQDSGLNLGTENLERIGVIVGSGVGGMQAFEEQHSVLLNRGPGRCSPFMIPEMISNMAAGLIAIDMGLKGPNYCLVSACASGAHSIGDA